jgi:hypothetical protein
MDYYELVQLAHLCARNAYLASTVEVAHTLWLMATEYQAQAAALGSAPNIGEPPNRIKGK